MAATLTLAITQNSQSIVNNTSNVTVKATIHWTYGSFNRTGECKGSITINGTKYSFSNLVFNSNQTTTGSQVVMSKTVNVAHNSDGTKSLSCSASFYTGLSSSGTQTASVSKTLTTIPRKSSLSVSNGTLGTALTLTVTKQSDSFKHTITYKCGSASGTVCTKSSSTSVAWNASNGNKLNLADQNTTGTSVSVTFTITTYNGTTSLGSNTKTVTMAIPASVKPSCSLKIIDASGAEGVFGGCVKGVSKFKVTITATAAYGSDIISYSTKIDGKTYTAASFISTEVQTAGTLTITATVKDKRGRTGSVSVTKTVIDYTQPVISKLAVRRCNEDGTANDKGEFAQATFSAAISSLQNQNTAHYTIRYKKTTETAYTEINLTAYTGLLTATDKTYIFAADSGSSYNVELIAEDHFKATKRATTVSTGFTLMHWSADGTGIGIGKMSEESNLFDVGMPARFVGAVSGNVMGLNKLPQIPANSDLNDYMETGSYAVYRNDDAETISNIPIARAGRLEVYSSTGEGIRASEWSYIRQKYYPYNSANAVWERDITRSSDNVWRYYNWWRSSLTPAAADYVYHEPKILWGEDLTSGMYMTAGHTINLSEAVSAQRHGIVLVFCYYNGTDDTNFSWQSFFVSKLLVAQTTAGHTFTLSRGKFTFIGTKYLYISDTSITGHNDNTLTGTANGITYANNKFVLRYVIGV